MKIILINHIQFTKIWLKSDKKIIENAKQTTHYLYLTTQSPYPPPPPVPAPPAPHPHPAPVPPHHA